MRGEYDRGISVVVGLINSSISDTYFGIFLIKGGAGGRKFTKGGGTLKS